MIEICYSKVDPGCLESHKLLICKGRIPSCDGDEKYNLQEDMLPDGVVAVRMCMESDGQLFVSVVRDEASLSVETVVRQTGKRKGVNTEVESETGHWFPRTETKLKISST